MEAKSKYVNTPVGKFPYPMAPGFTKELAKCKTDEDLFKLVEEKGFINPDAFTEVNTRGLYSKYKQWKEDQKLLARIKNDFNIRNRPTRSQFYWLKNFVKYNDVLEIGITRGGFISVDFKRKSREYPYGNTVIGRNGGHLSTTIGREYEDNTVRNGIYTDCDGFSKKV